MLLEKIAGLIGALFLLIVILQYAFGDREG